MSEGPRPWLPGDTGGAVKRHAPATVRNRDAIAAVLRDILPAQGSVLELASGSGEHVVHFARLFPSLTWQPSDPDPDALGSIVAWAKEADLPNIATPIAIDVRADDWGIERADAICCINMVHISPWEATEGLMRGAARLLPPGGALYLYGPYVRSDVETAASNLAFDRSLKERNPDWGLRNVDDVRELARRHGLIFHGLTDMPANNISLTFRKAG
jgi:SAM-dependent methyltransferase